MIKGNAVYIDNDTLIPYLVFGVGCQHETRVIDVIYQEYSDEVKPVFLMEIHVFNANFTLACELDQADKVGNNFLHNRIRTISKRLEREMNNEENLQS